MAEPHGFGPVVFITAEAIGQPGQRRFRLKAINAAAETTFLWLEKEQLMAIGDAIETVLREESFDYRPRQLDDRDVEPVFPLDADIEFRVGQLSMGVDRSDERIVLIAAEAVGEAEDGAEVMLSVDYQRGGELRQRIADVVAAGRPPCPLCGAPMDAQGHICPRSNGHHAQG